MATGFLVAVLASRYSVEHLTKFAAGTRIPPFIIGITLVSIGTDLPEIANSIVASVTGHGDVNVGDSIGSAVVQSQWGQRGDSEHKTELIFARNSSARLVDMLSEYLRD